MSFYPNLKEYRLKKLITQALFSIALLSANSEQLGNIIDTGEINKYFHISLVLIATSLVIQIILGIILIFESRCKIDNEQGFSKLEKLDNCLIIGIVIITVENLISSTLNAFS